MSEEMREEVRTFQVNDVLRLDIEIIDSSGVASVGLRFRNENPNLVKSVLKSIELSGEKHINTTLEIEIGKEFSPGQYTCEYISFTDILGNTGVEANPGIRFYVEGDLSDTSGPELKRLSLA